MVKNLKNILEKHQKWIVGAENGKRANLREADLRGADFYGADLREADLREADLREADLRGADFREADLREADFRDADFRDADLRGADFRGADFRDADLRGADFRDADLRGAKIELDLINKFYPICCPEVGSFIAWKKVRGNLIVKLEVTETAKRSSAFGRKCRCSEAKVLDIQNLDGTSADDVTVAYSTHDSNFAYRVGETVCVDNFDEDRKNECAPGIHFFITRQEAVEY